MAKINSKLLFLTTSPRTPAKMIPEIALLNEHFKGQEWDASTQNKFMGLLSEQDFFHGEGSKDPGFSARDRINRAPKALGFVSLKPTIQLTPAGEALINERNNSEIFLRQLLKFQLPSPYHKTSSKETIFCVKPYLEIFRLIRLLGTLKFDELQLFALQLTDYHNFDTIIAKIKRYRQEKAHHDESYKTFVGNYFTRELKHIFADEIATGHTKTRESNDTSATKFLSTKRQNMRDYADACFRYLHATGMVQVSHIGKSLSIIPEREADVDFFLQKTEREPQQFDDENSYCRYLGDPSLPLLLTDDRERLEKKLRTEFPKTFINTTEDLRHLKQLYAEQTEKRKHDTIKQQVQSLKAKQHYQDIQDTYAQIVQKQLLDAPLMFEWNTWRAITMLNGGTIKANLHFDDFGQPISTAQGNMADIVCDYDTFHLSVEVTLASGQRQYEMEGEPVARHLGKIKQQDNKPAYCLFIAPSINEACIAHFYLLHKANITYYGGRSTIIPLPLNVFQKMVENAHNADHTPVGADVRQLFEYSNTIAATCDNEQEWYQQIIERACLWPSW